MATDFSSLLSADITSVERPKPKPVGTYRLRVIKVPDPVESRDKGTPGMQFTFAYVEALADVDPDLLAEVDLTKGTLRDTFWLTDDALYRFREFLEKIGLDVETKTFKEIIPETPNQEVYAYISQQPSRSGDGAVFNTIDKYLSVEEATA